ncbi:MAG TPA: VOC family protein [Chloroflexota bacterium]|nr:VOC family protein [Chloroflexota bacterium]
MIRSVEHMAIAAQDTAGLARWYIQNLGFQVVVDGGEGGIWFVGPPEGQALVEIVPATDAQRVSRHQNDPGWSHLAFTVTDFDTLVASLKQKGVQFTGSDAQMGKPGERRLAFFLDGEGNVLQLIQRPTPLR